jgi:RNA polymerase primary sigma factor
VLVEGKMQLAYRQSVLERFLALHHDRVERGRRFSQTSALEREEILRRAKRMSRLGASLTEISRRIARRLGRSVETVRCTIKKHDRQHPAQALFPNLTGPLDAQTKQAIYSSYRPKMDSP